MEQISNRRRGTSVSKRPARGLFRPEESKAGQAFGIVLSGGELAATICSESSAGPLRAREYTGAHWKAALNKAENRTSQCCQQGPKKGPRWLPGAAMWVMSDV